VLVDPEKLAPENVERHLLGRRFVGRPKVEGVAEYLSDKGINPNTIIGYEVQAQSIYEAHTDADLAIVNIDDRGSLRDVNTWCALNNIPALYGGVYPRGTGGEVIVVPNPKDICYRCATYKMGRDEYEGFEVNYGLGEVTEVNTHGLPALHCAISATAADMADFALEILCGGNPIPQILVHAFNTWEPIFRPGPALNAVSSFIVSHPEMGLVSNMKIELEQGRYTLKAKRSICSLVLDRWEECQIHKPGQMYKPDEI
jgi:hypothetical protein